MKQVSFIRQLFIAGASAGALVAFAGAASAQQSADEVARQLTPDLDKFQAAYERAQASAANDGAANQPGGRSRSWVVNRPAERTRGYHSDVPDLQKRVSKAPSPKSNIRESGLQNVAAPQPPPQKPKPQRIETRIESRAYATNIGFEYNSAVITPAGRALLEQTIIPALAMVREAVAQRTGTWTQRPQVSFDVSGHTDTSGSDAYNLDLSRQRADAVCGYIRSRDPSVAMQCQGYGETRLLDTANTTSAVNRRVEIKGQVTIERQISSN